MHTTPEVTALLARPNHAILGINRRTGAPHLSVVWHLWDGEQFSFSTTTDRAKYLNLRRDPALSVLVNDPDEAWYVMAHGTAKLGERNHDQLARLLFAKYLPDEDPSRVANDPNRIAVTLHPDRMIVGR